MISIEQGIRGTDTKVYYNEKYIYLLYNIMLCYELLDVSTYVQSKVGNPVK